MADMAPSTVKAGFVGAILLSIHFKFARLTECDRRLYSNSSSFLYYSYLIVCLSQFGFLLIQFYFTALSPFIMNQTLLTLVSL